MTGCHRLCVILFNCFVSVSLLLQWGLFSLPYMSLSKKLDLVGEDRVSVVEEMKYYVKLIYENLK